MTPWGVTSQQYANKQLGIEMDEWDEFHNRPMFQSYQRRACGVSMIENVPYIHTQPVQTKGRLKVWVACGR